MNGFASKPGVIEVQVDIACFKLVARSLYANHSVQAVNKDGRKERAGVIATKALVPFRFDLLSKTQKAGEAELLHMISS